MITERTLKYVKETINHPYVGIKILPMVGDFCGHATNTAKALLRDEVITTDTFYGLTELINGIEKQGERL